MPCRLLIVVLSLSAIAGCNSKPAPESSATSASTETPTASQEHANDAAEELLKNVVSILQSSTDANSFPTVLKQLNQFVERRADAIPTFTPEYLDKLNKELGPQAAAEISRKTFVEADTEYLRNTLFLRSVARSLQSRQDEGTIDEAKRLFEWVIRYVQLVPSGTQAEGMPVDVCLRGVGNADERMWVFAELARQAGLQSCVVGIPAPSSPNAAGAIMPWLCGVIQKDEVYLFDPVIGLPVPAADGGVATLKQLSAAPKIVNRLAPDPKFPYRVPAIAMKGFSLLLPLEPEMLAPRMAFLESRLSGDTRANLSLHFGQWVSKAQEALKPIAGNQGVRVWQYPQLIRAQLRQNRHPFLQSMNLTWLMTPDSARMLQLRGQHEEAIQKLVKLDIENMSPAEMNAVLAQRGMPPELRRTTVNRTPQDVLYFLGLSKLDMRKSQPEVARDWFKRYLDRYGASDLRPSDILEWGEFTQKLLAEGTKPEPSPSRRIWELLPEPVRKTVSTIRDNYEGALKQANLPQGAKIVMKVDHNAQKQIAAAINELLKRRDFYDAKDFATVVEATRTQQLWDVDPKALSDAEVLSRNRFLLDASFPTEISRYHGAWLAGAIRHTAIALRQEGKTKEAIDLLQQDHPGLLPIHRAAFLALAESWRKEGAKEK